METLESLVLTELGDHFETADRLMAGYAKDYVRSLAGGPKVRPPVGLHPDLARLVRNVALDASMMDRRAVA